jgi:hypothetical protein
MRLPKIRRDRSIENVGSRSRLTIRHIKESFRKTHARKGEAVVQKNFAAVDGRISH